MASNPVQCHRCDFKIIAKDHFQFYMDRGACWNCTPDKTVLDFCKRSVVRGQVRMTTLHHRGVCYLPMWAPETKATGKFWWLYGDNKAEWDLPWSIYSKLRFGTEYTHCWPSGASYQYRQYTTYDEAALDFTLANYVLPPKRTIFQLFGGE